MKKGGDLVLYRNRREEISSYIETEETRSRFTSKQKGRDLVLYRNRMDEISSYIETEGKRSRLISKQNGRDEISSVFHCILLHIFPIMNLYSA